MLLCPSNFASETLAAGGDLRSGDLASKLALTSHLVTVRPERLGDLAVNDRRVPASMVRGLHRMFVEAGARIADTAATPGTAGQAARSNT